MIKEKIFIALQKIVPQHLLSRLIGKLANSHCDHIKNPFIHWFINHFDVDLSQAKIEDYKNFENFNAFFTRELKDGARPICNTAKSIASPADGAISEIGDIELGSILQAKGHKYSLISLLAGDADLSAKMLGGKFATVYLSPKDYHRVHMPVTGKLVKTTYVPGKLFSVNQTTANNVPGLFAQNERLICEFDSSSGPFVMILVGAMIVAGIETVWQGQVAPPTNGLQTLDINKLKNIRLKKGEEMGRFMLGSTVILLFPEDTNEWSDELQAGSELMMGQQIGTASK